MRSGLGRNGEVSFKVRWGCEFETGSRLLLGYARRRSILLPRPRSERELRHTGRSFNVKVITSLFIYIANQIHFLNFSSKSNPGTPFTCNLTHTLVQQSHIRTSTPSKSFNNHKKVRTLNSNYPNAPFGHKQTILQYHETGIYLPSIGMYPTNKWSIHISFLRNAYIYHSNLNPQSVYIYLYIWVRQLTNPFKTNNLSKISIYLPRVYPIYPTIYNSMPLIKHIFYTIN